MVATFGQHFTKYGHFTQQGMAKKYFLKIWRNMHFVRYYPAEALSEPIFRTWHFFWRMKTRNNRYTVNSFLPFYKKEILSGMELVALSYIFSLIMDKRIRKYCEHIRKAQIKCFAKKQGNQSLVLGLASNGCDMS